MGLPEPESCQLRTYLLDEFRLVGSQGYVVEPEHAPQPVGVQIEMAEDQVEIRLCVVLGERSERLAQVEAFDVGRREFGKVGPAAGQQPEAEQSVGRGDGAVGQKPPKVVMALPSSSASGSTVCSRTSSS